ncbi:MAG: hypothetical protein H7Z38_15275 [Rubrivivax sp.]|nr:hypothetical protein [Pyrinomonadaceae bacterium]
MKKFLIVSLVALLCAPPAIAQQKPAAKPAQKPDAKATKQQPAQQQQRPAPPLSSPDLNDYGIQIAPDSRLIVMMAALDAAGWDPTPAGGRLSVFRELLRKDQAALDPSLAKRMRDFYERNALRDVRDNPATPVDETVRYTPADQVARYISLAYTLGQPPTFESPSRSDDLPSGVLDVLDFTPLLREFYRQSGMDGRLNAYVGAHRAAGDKLRAPAIDMARSVLSYMNTRPETLVTERVSVGDAAQGDKKKKDAKTLTVERDRRFRLVPDLLAAPGSINLRAVGDDYYAIVPADVELSRSEARRAYIQFVVDPLVARFNRDVAARRTDIKLLLEKEHERKGSDLTPDVFLSVARSIVAAADARMDESARLRALQIEMSGRLQRASFENIRAAILKESKERQSAIEDSTTARLADAYERGAVLSFFFAEQLKELEGSGFDIANFISPMVADFKAERELKRPAEFADAIKRVRDARKLALEARSKSAPTDERRTALIKSLSDVDDLLRVRNYSEAETRLLALKSEYREEPRVYFALGQAASISAQEAFDETLQSERLNAALQHFRQAILFASPEADGLILLRARLASGRILAHFERRDEALKEFDAVISASAPTATIHQEALAEKKKLGGQE